MDSKLYRNTILDLLLFPFRMECEEEYGYTEIMEDNAPGHWGVSVPYRIFNRLRTFWWPPQSPDMNPLETLWNDMKKELGKEEPCLRALAEITAYAQRIWMQLQNRD